MPDAPSVLTAAINNMGLGWHPFAGRFNVQYQQMGGYLAIVGPLWKELENVRWDTGQLEFRPGIQDDLSGGQIIAADYSVDSRTEVPIYLFQVTSAISGTLTVHTVYISTTDIWIHNGSSWVNRTPTYTDGTASVSGTAVTGVGTLWVTRHIKPGQQILINGNWHEIASVGGETSITLTSSAGTAGAAAYTIRRTLGSGVTVLETFAKVFNNDLYVAGSGCGGDDEPAVILVSSITAGSTPGDYLLAQNDLTSGVENFDNEGETVYAIRGLDVLQDGRVIIASEESPDRVSRVRYSSHLNQAVWFTSPGGFTDVVAGGSGKITGLGRLGRVTTVHYADGIAIGSPTGQDDPPLNFESTRADTGAMQPHTIKNFGGYEYFIGDGGLLYRFNGSTSEPVAEEFRIEGGDNVKQVEQQVFAWLDRHLGEYSWCSLDTNVNDPLGVHYAYNFRTRQVRRNVYPARLTAFLDSFAGTPGVSFEGRGTYQTLAAYTDAPTGGTPKIVTLQDRSGEDASGDVDSNYDGVIGGITWPMDFGMPTVEKIIERVQLWVSRPSFKQHALTSDTIQVALSPDGGQTFPLSASQTVVYANDDEIEVLEFSWDATRSSEHWSLRLLVTTTSAGNGGYRRFAGAIHRIVVKYALLSDLEGRP